MKYREQIPPRAFCVGKDQNITIKDCAQISLDADEQVTFVTEAGGEFDITRKDWGFYATPSINGRLAKFGFRTALVRNSAGMMYILLIEKGKEELFSRYLKAEGLSVVEYLGGPSPEDVTK